MPANRSPSRIRDSQAWRPAAIRKTAVWLVSAPHSVRRSPAVFQPVSSMLTTGAVLSCCSRGVRRGERLAGALDDRVDRTGRQLDPEQLPRELGRVAAGDTVAHGERHDRGLQPRPERRAGHAGGKLGPGLGSTLAATDTVQPMLGHPDRDRRQLGELVARRCRSVNPLCLAERVRARAAALRPMLDDLVDLLGRKQPPMPALMPRLAAPTPPRPLPTRTRRRRRRILRRRQRRVPRTALEPPLELGHPRLQPLVRLHQRPDPDQQRDRRLPVAVQDRLRLGPLHTGRIRRQTPGPCTGPERLPILRIPGICSGIELTNPTGQRWVNIHSVTRRAAADRNELRRTAPSAPPA
jgi:hypothetical protein